MVMVINNHLMLGRAHNWLRIHLMARFAPHPAYAGPLHVCGSKLVSSRGGGLGVDLHGMDRAELAGENTGTASIDGAQFANLSDVVDQSPDHHGDQPF